MEVLAERKDDEEGQHDDDLQPVGPVVARAKPRVRQRRDTRGDRAADHCVGALVRDCGVGVRKEREAERIERVVREHDRDDQPEHQERFAIALEARRLTHEPPV